MPWLEPSLTLKWGPYVKPTPEDDAQLVNVAVLAKRENLITVRSAVDKIRSVFAIEDVDAFIEALQTEADARQKRAMDMAAARGGVSAAPGEADKEVAGNQDGKRDGKGNDKPNAQQNPFGRKP